MSGSILGIVALTLLLAEKSGLGVTQPGRDTEELERLTASLAKRFEQAVEADISGGSSTGSGS